MKPGFWRRLSRVLHRDLGYLFFGTTVVYAVSGLALNHLRDWNPNYRVEQRTVTLDAAPPAGHALTRTEAQALLAQAGVTARYKQHYEPAGDQVRIFYEGGTATLDRAQARLSIEELHRRPLLHTFNRLHYNPGRWWTWFSDAFCVALLIVAVTGLFLLRGHHGLTRRGGVLVALGIAVPAALVFSLL